MWKWFRTPSAWARSCSTHSARSSYKWLHEFAFVIISRIFLSHYFISLSAFRIDCISRLQLLIANLRSKRSHFFKSIRLTLHKIDFILRVLFISFAFLGNHCAPVLIRSGNICSVWELISSLWNLKMKEAEISLMSFPSLRLLVLTFQLSK